MVKMNSHRGKGNWLPSWTSRLLSWEPACQESADHYMLSSVSHTCAVIRKPLAINTWYGKTMKTLQEHIHAHPCYIFSLLASIFQWKNWVIGVVIWIGTAPIGSLGSGTIRIYVFVGLGVALLGEVCHWWWDLGFQMLSPTSLFSCCLLTWI